MDPNANLDELLRLVKKLQNEDAQHGTFDGSDVTRVLDLVEALDHWLTGLGFLPERWAAGPQEAARLAASKAHAEGRRVGIEVLASAVKKTLTAESLENLVRVLNAPRG